jgi:hypothetical protein
MMREKDAMATLRSFLKNMGISAMEFEFVLRTFALVLTMLSVVHLVGCLWLAVGRMGWEEDNDGWMVDAGYGDFKTNGHNYTYDSVRKQYIDATYWAIVTMSSDGYGDLLPVTTSERKITIFIIVLGAFLYAYIIGSFSTIMSHLDFDKARYVSTNQPPVIADRHVRLRPLLVHHLRN